MVDVAESPLARGTDVVGRGRLSTAGRGGAGIEGREVGGASSRAGGRLGSSPRLGDEPGGRAPPAVTT